MTKNLREKTCFLPSEIRAVGILLALALAGLLIAGLTRWMQAGKNVGNLEASAHRIDLNEAQAWELSLIPGIGEKKAAAIVDYRYRKGSFSTFEELEQIPGFGARTVQRIKPYFHPLR